MSHQNIQTTIKYYAHLFENEVFDDINMFANIADAA